MKILIPLFLTVFLSGCSLMVVPSFWDANQAESVVNIQVAVKQLDCDNVTDKQIDDITNEITWFQTYSESSGWRHQDMIELIEPLDETVDAFAERYQSEETINSVYCELKKKNMTLQSQRVSEAVLGRFKL